MSTMSATSIISSDSYRLAPSPEGRLGQLQLRVARRADELARCWRLVPGADRTLWLRAEQEIFELEEADGGPVASAGEGSNRDHAG